MTKIKCNKCGYEWDYKGICERYACCPRCRKYVKFVNLIEGKIIE
jgi:hypothetical protein